MKIIEYELEANHTWRKPKRTIIERAKTYAGNRNVCLTTTAKKILKMVKNNHIQNGPVDSEYIFLSNGKPCNGICIDSRLRKYCRHSNIAEKGTHKIRKTYISALIDSNNVNINAIRSQVGHTDERTTYQNYCYCSKSNIQTMQAIEKALS